MEDYCLIPRRLGDEQGISTTHEYREAISAYRGLILAIKT